MGKLTFILGGARSGKSSYAQRLAANSGQSVTYIATAQAMDEEMAARIQKHREERPDGWETLEIPLGVAYHASQIQTGLVVLDCITLLATNILMQFVRDDLVDEARFMHALRTEIDALQILIRTGTPDWLVVSNEVGLGLVPPYPMGRVYRDGLGWANQRLASEAEDVFWMVAGIPVPIAQYKLKE